MTLIRKLRAYFTTATSVDRADGTHGGVRFLKTDKPSEETMRRLLDSAAFIGESDDRAKLSSGGDVIDEQGLTVLASDTQAKSNATQLTDRSLVAQPHQLPTVVPGATNADNISGTIPFTGIAMDVAPDTTATRNNFIVKLSTGFKTWLGAAHDTLNASITAVASSVSTVSGALTTFMNTFSGGTSGQILTKGTSGYSWQNPASGLPSGGTTGQILTKNSATPGDASWQTPATTLTVPIGGIIMYDGNADNFDVNGIGIGPLVGFALCTGYGGLTPNLSGRFIVAANTFGITTIGSIYSDASGSYPYSLGNVGGESKHLLTANESGLRDHIHHERAKSSDTTGSGELGGGSANVSDDSANAYTDGVDGGPQPAIDYHENRPPYYALAYIKRIS